MKGIIFSLLFITSIIANSFLFLRQSQRLATEFLDGSRHTVVNLEIPQTQLSSVLIDLIPHLENFSYEHGISIAQIQPLFDGDIIIHMANMEANNQIQLLKGNYPSEGFHLSNRPLHVMS